MKNGIYKPASSYADDGVPCLRMYNIERGRIVWRDIKRMRLSAEEVQEYGLRPGDLLVNRVNSRELVGKAAVIPDDMQASVFESKNIRVRLRTDLALPRFVSYRLELAGTAYFTNNAQQVVGMASISQPQVAAFPLPLPPLADQALVVAEIEKQFTRLDAAVAVLKGVQANLKRYRASVLKAACEGRLVEATSEYAIDDRARVVADSIVPGSTGRSEDSVRGRRLWGAGHVPDLRPDERLSLPKGWTWTKVKNLGGDPETTVQVGPMSMRSKDFGSAGVPVLNVGSVRWGSFDETKLDYLPEGKARGFERYRIRSGDVLFTRSGTVGRSAVAQPHQEGWLITFHLLRARPDPQTCLPSFLRIVFEGASHVRRQTREASIGSTRAGFNTRLLADLDVPLPPLSEQHRIIAEVERRLSVIEEMETTVAVKLQRAARLRQSVLQAAFAGKLVSADSARS